MEKELETTRLHASEVNALYEVEKGTNAIKTEQLTSAEEENLSLRKELYQLLDHIGTLHFTQHLKFKALLIRLLKLQPQYL